MTTIRAEEAAASNWLRETHKGYLRIATLILLSKKPCHGYEVMKEIRDKTSGFWKPTAGGIYPVLKDLEESGYVQGKWDAKTKRRKKIYTITESGRAVLRNALAKEEQLASAMKNLFEEYVKDVLEVDTQSTMPLSIPLPLSNLLRGADEKEEDRIRRLEAQRTQLQTRIKQLQKALRTVNKQLPS